jgi:protein required for attachment to host cells
MILPAGTHVAVADGARFVLMRNSGTATEPRLANEAAPDIEATNFSAGIRHQDGNDHIPREPLDEFAHAAGVAEFLNRKTIANEIEKLVVIADPSSLGEMRKHWHKETKGALLAEIAKTMTNAASADILKAIDAE